MDPENSLGLTFDCHECNDVINMTDENYEDGKQYCTSCFDELFGTCHNCDGIYYQDDMQTVGEKDYCEDCYSELFYPCDDCSDIVSVDDIISVDNGGGNVCRSCRDDNYLSCDSCCDVFHRDSDNYRVDDSMTLCESCGEDYYYCYNCEQLVYTEDVCYDEDNCEHYCVDCYENLGGGDDNRLSHHPTMSPEFHGKGAYYGVEIETDKFRSSRSDVISELNNIKGDNFYLQSDSSLDSGVEITYHPRSIDSWLNFEDELIKINKIVRRNGGRSYDTKTCGIHVHRSRKGLSDITLTKLVIFFVKCKAKIIKVAQRDVPGYATFSHFHDETNPDDKLIYKRIKGKKIVDKFCAINLSHKNTIEFRIFKGTLHVDTIISYILFCDYVIAYVKNISIKYPLARASCVLWADFRIYLSKQGRHGNRLLRYMESKGV